MTGITCNTIAEIRASAERDSDPGKEEGDPPEVAAKETKQKCESDAEIRPPPGRGEESGMEVRQSSGRGEERLPSGRGEEWLAPPPEGEGEGARPTTSAPPLFSPLPPSSEASPPLTPSNDGQSGLQGKAACDLLQSVLQHLQDMSSQLQHISIVANPATGKMRLPLRDV